MKLFSHIILYPWYNDAYEHCDSCIFRNHDEEWFSKKRCRECIPRERDSHLKEDEYYLPTGHQRKKRYPSNSWYEGSLEQAADRARMRRHHH